MLQELEVYPPVYLLFTAQYQGHMEFSKVNGH